MLDGIKLQVTSILIPLAVDCIQNNLMGDWLGAVQHMSIKIAQRFPPRSWKQRTRQTEAHWVYTCWRAEAEMVEAERVAVAEVTNNITKSHMPTVAEISAESIKPAQWTIDWCSLKTPGQPE